MEKPVVQAPEPAVAKVLQGFIDAYRGAANPPVIEEYLARVDAADRPHLLRQLLGHEFQMRQIRMESIDPSIYIQRFPDHRAIVDEALATVLRNQSTMAFGGQVTVLEKNQSPPDVPTVYERLLGSGLRDGLTIEELKTLVPTRMRQRAETLLEHLVQVEFLTPWQANTIWRQAKPRLRVGRYVLVDKIGQGGMGVVYRARHTLIDRQVALKMMRPEIAQNPEAVNRFLREAQACVQIEHPHIVPVYDVDRIDDSIYMTMALIDGINLDSYIRERGAMSIGTALDTTRQAALGLAHAHHRGIVHRDVKPHNILRETSGHIRVLDMGLARILGESLGSDENVKFDESQPLSLQTSRLTHSGVFLGTAAYMAPEHAEHPRLTDARSDIYSLGCTLYFLLTAVHAFQSESVGETLARHRRGEYRRIREFLPNVSNRLACILEKMLAPDPNDRFASMDEVAEVLQHSEGTRTLNSIAEIQLQTPTTVGHLKEILLDYEFITPEEWDDAAKSTSEQELVGSGDDAELLELKGTGRFRPKKADDQGQGSRHRDVMDMLERLGKQPSRRFRGYPCLSSLQSDAILSGNASILRFGDYLLDARIHHGSAGEIFTAFNIHTRRRVVIRTFSLALLSGLSNFDLMSEGIAAFEKHMARVAAVSHPALITPISWGVAYQIENRTALYFAADEVDGPRLEQFVTGTEYVGWEELRHGLRRRVGWALDVIHPIARGLEMAHRAGLLHGSVGPRSIMLDRDRGAVLIDLGIFEMLRPGSGASGTRKERPATTGVGAIMSNPQLLAPERLIDSNDLTESADLYGLGCVFFFMLVGELPFQNLKGSELISAVIRQSPLHHPRLRHIPREIRVILNRLLAKSPSERYVSAREFLNALDPLVAKVTSDGFYQPASGVKRWAIIFLIGSSVGAALAMAWWFLR